METPWGKLSNLSIHEIAAAVSNSVKANTVSKNDPIFQQPSNVLLGPAEALPNASMVHL
jgi:hypothetical protein